MFPRSSFRVVLFLSVLLGGAECCRACGFAAQRIVSAKTVEALPAPLAAFYMPRLDSLIERAIEPGGAWKRDPGMKSRGPWHRLMLDVAAAGSGHAERMRAAFSFPATRSKARTLFRKHQVKGAGKLIWVLDELVGDLADAMRKRNTEAIIKTTGYIMHFATDAANPFHTTRNERGQETGNAIFGERVMGDPLFAHQDVAHRVGWELVRRNAERYRDAIDANAIRFEIVEEVPYAALERMVEALDSLDVICEADRNILSRMEIADGSTLLARQDEYYELLDQASGKYAIENLRRGVRLAATLIVTAWVRAGSPASLVDAPPPQAPEHVVESGSPPEPGGNKSKQPDSSPAVDQAGFVASKNSKVFHRASCSHAQRISPKNIVRFGSVQEGIDSGRRPCRTCKPGEG